MTREQRKHVLDADWTQIGEHDPEAYSRRCSRIQRAEHCRKVAYVQRLIVAGAALVLAAAVILAVMPTCM